MSYEQKQPNKKSVRRGTQGDGRNKSLKPYPKAQNLTEEERERFQFFVCPSSQLQGCGNEMTLGGQTL